ncbi:MAG: calcium-binding protein, partial [Nitrososphaeraceae archaeon]
VQPLPQTVESAFSFGHVSGKEPNFKNYNHLEGFLVNEVFAESSVLGFQNTAKTPQGDLTTCSGNFLVPSSICVGTHKNDTIIGTIAGGTIFGKDGNDKIMGLLSQQVIYGNAGNDTIQGGNSTNIIFGNNGDDTLVGGSGFDPMKGGGGSMLSGDRGNDKLLGGPDHDVLEGGPGFDFFQCNGKVDIVLDFDPKEDKAAGDCIFA